MFLTLALFVLFFACFEFLPLSLAFVAAGALLCIARNCGW